MRQHLIFISLLIPLGSNIYILQFHNLIIPVGIKVPKNTIMTKNGSNSPIDTHPCLCYYWTGAKSWDDANTSQPKLSLEI